MSINQCSDTYLQKVEVLNLIADAGNDTTVCINTITLNGSGNYNNLNYLWSSNSNFTDTLNNYPYSNSVSLTFNNPGYLFFQIEKANCDNYDSVFIDQRIKPSIANITNPLCNGDSNGSILLTINGGISPLNYLWNNGQTTNPATNLNSGNYSVTITDIDGCTNSIDTLLTEPEPLTSNNKKEDIPCTAACIGKAWANPQGGTTPYNWQWDDGNSQTMNPAIQLCNGIYHVTISDANNCLANDSVEIIDSSLYITFKAWANDDTIYKDNSTQLHSTFLGSNFIYSWSPSTGLSNPNSPSTTANPTSTTTYTIDAIDQYGCSYHEEITIFVLDVICEEPYIYVPNAFTPNNDGKNDVLFVNSSVGYEMVFKIYDRWGELVFESNDISKGWDGTFRDKLLKADVYVYYLELTCYNQDLFIKKGNITLIR
jgi:gliding motility-associated-like protein